MLSSFVSHEPHSLTLVTVLLLGFVTGGCSSGVGTIKENTGNNVANTCDPTKKTMGNDSLNSSCGRKTIAELVELGESSKYRTYLNVDAEIGNPLNILLFSYDKAVKELVGLTGSLISIGSQEKEEENEDVVAETDSTEALTGWSRIITEVMNDYNYNDVETDKQGHRQHFTRGTSVLSQAYRFLGVPYRRGGTTPKGFDCSGLVYYLHKNVGVSLPRTAHAQYLNSFPVAQSDLQAGDLVFFRTNRGTRRITHVGVYVGDNKFIHSRSPGKRVAITSLSNSYYRSRFVRGGRV